MPGNKFSGAIEGLIEGTTGNRSAYTVKRRSGGGVEFSRDPLNLLGKHSRVVRTRPFPSVTEGSHQLTVHRKKHDGYINDKAIGIQPSEKGGVTLLTKKSGTSHKPASSTHTSTFSSSTSGRKSYRTIVNSTAKKGYRSDLRAAAVKRASAIKASQKPVKADKETKLRGAKAKKAAESS
jgi:large subunit ribosomal protein L28e